MNLFMRENASLLFLRINFQRFNGQPFPRLQRKVELVPSFSTLKSRFGKTPALSNSLGRGNFQLFIAPCCDEFEGGGYRNSLSLSLFSLSSCILFAPTRSAFIPQPDIHIIDRPSVRQASAAEPATWYCCK